MQSAVVTLIAVVIALCALASAAPALIALAHALLPLVLVGGIIVTVARLVWHFTNRY
jgi:hypothetical protein